MLNGKKIVLGVTGGIAAYKAASLASLLCKAGAEVDVIMTKNACELITPLTFSTLTRHAVSTDTFARVGSYDVSHISLAQKADLMVVAPATANILAKMAHGIADDMLSTVLLACHAPKLVAPAMNTGMLNAPATQENLETLRGRGVELIEGGEGLLACGDVGRGRMAEPEEILERIRSMLTPKDLTGRRVLVTAGPTREPLDPVRFLSNRSSGKMGYAVAAAAAARGAQVTLVSGPTALTPPAGTVLVPVETAAEMFEAVRREAALADLIVKAAAVADYTPQSVCAEKLKKSDAALTLELARTRDILAWLGENRRPGQVIAGFAMETENLLENARAKLLSKGVDLIAANSLREPGAGFGGDTNILTLITREGSQTLPMLSKDEAANRLLDALLPMLP